MTKCWDLPPIGSPGRDWNDSRPTRSSYNHHWWGAGGVWPTASVTWSPRLLCVGARRWLFAWPCFRLAEQATSTEARDQFKDFAKIWLRLALHFENENALLHIWSGSGRPKSLTSRRAAW